MILKRIKKMYSEHGVHDVQIGHVTKSDVLWWHNKVQYFINNYQKERGDYKWNWINFYNWFGILRSVKLYKITVKGVSGEDVMIGIMQLHENSNFIDGSGKSVFLWYVSNLPFRICQEMGVSRLKDVGRVLVDVAICKSYQLEHKGRLWLHAAKPNKYAVKLNMDLVKFYKRLEMQRYKAQYSITGIRRNDGRYFYHDEQSAVKAVELLNQYR
ncbi:MAG: hypothetical protein QM504_06575 [Pseudomonadota bacterium]